MNSDTIAIRGLQMATRIGVPDVERERWQTLEIDAVLTTKTSFKDVGDDLSRTVDYEAVCLRLRDWAAANERRLLESLGEDLAANLLSEFAIASVQLTIRKYIIPGTKSVGVCLSRTAQPL